MACHPPVVRLAVLRRLLAANVAYGTYRLTSAKFRQGPRVALLQSNLIQRYKEAERGRPARDLYNLVVRAAAASRAPI